MDGGSSDGSVDILRRYGNWLSWVSQRDRGQSDAINQGLGLAGGDIVAYLNSDDLYLPGGVHAIADRFRQQPAVGLAYGDCRVIDETGHDLGFLPRHPFDLRRTIERGEFLPQQAVFWRREAMTKVGLLDDDLHYAMDYEYFIRIARSFPCLTSQSLSRLFACKTRRKLCHSLRNTGARLRRQLKVWIETLEAVVLDPLLASPRTSAAAARLQDRIRRQMDRPQDPYLYAGKR